MSGRFYDTREWRDVIRPQQLRREPLCRICKARGRVVPATQVDHVLPMDAGGDPRDEANLQSLCESCHSLKTRADHGASVQWGCDASGRPLDPSHPWNAASKRA